MTRRLAVLLVLLLVPGCLAVERWPEIEPPYTPAAIESGRDVYVRVRRKPPVTIRKPVWEIDGARAWISGSVREEPDTVADLPRAVVNDMVFEQNEPDWHPGRVAVDEITEMRMDTSTEPGPNLTLLAVLLCAGLVVLIVVAA